MLNFPKLTNQKLSLLVTAYIAFILNAPFYLGAWRALQQNGQVNYLFLASLPVFLFCIIFLLVNLLRLTGCFRYFAALLVLVSGGLFYATFNYGVVFNYDMIVNIAETDVREGASYLNGQLLVYLALFAVLPALLVLRLGAGRGSYLRELKQLSLNAVALVAVLLVVAMSFYSNYASLGRNHRHLQKMIVPTQFVWSSGKLIKQRFFSQPHPFTELVDTATHTDHPTEPYLVVMVLGETARAQNFSLNGYDRPTNAFTSAYPVVSYRHMSSCGTATAYSVPCMFSFLNEANYRPERASQQENVLDVIQKAGFDVFWLDNDSGCKGVCKRVLNTEIETTAREGFCDGEYCYDEALISGLDQLLAQPLKRDTLVILHTIGSHGPTYYRRYPKSFAHFMPDCQRSDIQNCSQDALVNTYDNTLLYTDAVIAEVIERLSDRPNTSSVFYVSDHGESLGESGLYLHGTPKLFAPDEQTQVANLLWLSDAFKAESHIDLGCLEKQAEEGQFSHDYIVHTLLDLTAVRASVYDPSLSLLQSCVRPQLQVSQNVPKSKNV
ncbi:phosphoethanolamine--lipid A transferase [Neptuniibacter sp. CAU 1671]|uniref:phosphoethanolamine transferase n=1 Tax=Neptuniibacter sp. CAU 1671 TaxID=3032593 RepID=UPI0023DCC588|nr:phosphoethanolamine--lipid A transferase [Neptuniibacter sp. CAU 1671]MDF2181303.1 phosphoethanolamine--lipid A transferase [Neptuniibacter sp. CAU 1671]